MLIIRAFLPENSIGFTLANFAEIFSKPFFRNSVINSLKISVISSLIGIFVAFFGAKAANSANGFAKKFFMSILNMTSNFAGVPLAFAFIILLGNTGVLVLLGKHLEISALAGFNVYSYLGLLLIYIYFQLPLATLLLIPVFSCLRKEWKEAVNLMGGSNLRYWLKVGIPVMLPSILGTFSVLFSNALAAYASAYALVQGNYSLLAIRVTEQFSGDMVQRKEFGSALAVVMMLFMVICTYFSNSITKNNERRIKNNDKQP